jgi:hypothetical protein
MADHEYVITPEIDMFGPVTTVFVGALITSQNEKKARHPYTSHPR